MSTTALSTSTLRRTSRAVDRLIAPGNEACCRGCGDPVRFSARIRARQVIANVYTDRRWDRVEHYHADCYDEAGRPHGVPML